MENSRQVCIAGRIMSKRIMGKASFAELLDSKGRIQVYITRDDNITDSWDDWYRVTVVGQGLTVTNDDFGALILWDGN